MDRKADQISSHFYTKLFYVVCEARDNGGGREFIENTTTGGGGSGTTKVDKWFNLNTPTPTRPGRSSPFTVSVVLVLPDIKPTQVVVSLPSRMALPTNTHEVLLEKWTISVASASGSQASTDTGANVEEHDLPTVYKHGIPLFRGAWSLLRVLPAWRMRGKLRRMGGRVEVRVSPSQSSSSSSSSSTSSTDAVWVDPPQTHSFASVPHPRGSLILMAEYLPSPSFRIDERESLLSSRIRKEDEDDFVPTLRSGATGGSVSRLRKDSTPGPSSSPSMSSPLNPNAQAASSLVSRPPSILSSSPRPQPILTNSPRPPSLLSSSPARRPHPHPFKSDTLSGSLSSVNIGLTGLVGSIGTGTGTPVNPQAPAQPVVSTSSSTQRRPLEDRPSSPSLTQSPSPFPTSISVSPSNPTVGDRPTRKRYSSSFGQRYAARSDSPGSTSTGSSFSERSKTVTAANAGGLGLVGVPSSSAIPSSASGAVGNKPPGWTDEDDVLISEFVQDIDARKPLRRVEPSSPQPLPSSPPRSPQSPPRYISSLSTSPRTSPRMVSSPLAASPTRTNAALILTNDSTGSQQRAVTDGGRVLTNQEVIAKELQRMNDEFMKSLEGLGSGRRKEREMERSDQP